MGCGGNNISQGGPADAVGREKIAPHAQRVARGVQQINQVVAFRDRRLAQVEPLDHRPHRGHSDAHADTSAAGLGNDFAERAGRLGQHGRVHSHHACAGAWLSRLHDAGPEDALPRLLDRQCGVVRSHRCDAPHFNVAKLAAPPLADQEAGERPSARDDHHMRDVFS
eukprot:scaffold5382_cov114-Isochrysis_galbana.AAC.2